MTSHQNQRDSGKRRILEEQWATVEIEQGRDKQWSVVGQDFMQQDDFQTFSEAVDAFQESGELDGYHTQFKRTPYFDNAWKRDSVEDMKLAVSYDPFIYKDLSPEIQNQFEVAKAAVIGDSLMYSFLPDSLKENRDLALIAVESHPYNITSLNNTFANDIEIAKTALRIESTVLRYCKPSIKDNEECVRIAIKGSSDQFQYASARLKDNIDLAVFAHQCSYDYQKVIHDSNHNAAYLERSGGFMLGRDLPIFMTPFTHASDRVKSIVGESPRHYAEIAEGHKHIESILPIKQEKTQSKTQGLKI